MVLEIRRELWRYMFGSLKLVDGKDKTLDEIYGVSG